jgi:hypothetical protein
MTLSIPMAAPVGGAATSVREAARPDVAAPGAAAAWLAEVAQAAVAAAAAWPAAAARAAAAAVRSRYAATVAAIRAKRLSTVLATAALVGTGCAVPAKIAGRVPRTV